MNNEDDLQQSYNSKKGSYPVATRHLAENNEPLFINRLVKQDSLYLLQHAHNPVDWWPWEEEAFETARKLDKPILLSIGYSTCHWCHVMERESFENTDIANFINQNFIPIKVDREEHPDLDEIYLNAVQMLSGKAGWPLTAVLTADAQPFFGGTYFPPDQFLDLLKQISDTWSHRRPAVMEQANRLEQALSNINRNAKAAIALDDSTLAAAQSRIQQSLNANQNSEGATFPREPEMLYLLQRAFDKLEQAPYSIVQQRLTAIANGGIHDHLAGGFHRYSVDANWQVPHFEKMLYNQAQLGQLYSLAHMISGDQTMRTTAESTFDFALREMQSADGGFFSAIDAESSGREGSYYIWDFEELKKLLTETELQLAKSMLGVSPEGNFSGSNVLRLSDVSTDPQQNELNSALNKLKIKLAKSRASRERPRTDTKIITAWNGMLISALVTGYKAIGREDYKNAAARAADTIWKHAYVKKHGLLRTIPGKGKPIIGALEDYAYYSNALIDLYDLSGENKWLSRADEIATEMIDRFHNKESGGFSISNATSAKKLLVTLSTARDDAINSGNSVAAQSLAKLYRRTGNVEYRKVTRSVLSAFSEQMTSTPESLAGMLAAAKLLNVGETGQTQYGGKGMVKVESSIVASKLVIKLTMAPKWHVNAHRVLEDHLIPTKLSPEKSRCVSIGNVTYPEGKLVSLGFQDDELLVYENQISISAEYDPSSNSGCSLVTAQLAIQACSDEVCQSPERLKIRVPVITQQN